MIDVPNAFIESGAISRLGEKAFAYLMYIVAKEDRCWQTPYHGKPRPGVATTDFQICEALGWPSGKKAWESCQPIRRKLMKDGWIEWFQRGHRGVPSLYRTNIPQAYLRMIAPSFSGGNPGVNTGGNGGDLYTYPLIPTPPVEEALEVSKTASQKKTSNEMLEVLARFSTQLQSQVLELTELFIVYSPGRRSPKIIAELAESIGTHLEGDSGLYELLRAHFTPSPEDMDREIKAGNRLPRHSHPHEVISHLRQRIPKPRVARPTPVSFKPASQAIFSAKESATHAA